MRYTVLISAALLGITACSKAPALTPQPTSPPPTQRSEPVRTRMMAFAEAVRDLHDALAKKDPVQKDVLEVLNRIDGVADKLEKFAQQTGHPLFVANLPRFRAEVKYAIEHVSAPKPTYTYAGGVVGACATCHGMRECPFNRDERCVNAPIY